MTQERFSSERLYEECLKGNPEAWNEANRYVYGVLSRFCWHMDEEERNDLTNETLLYFLSGDRLDTIKEPKAFRKLLKLKAKGIAIDHGRKTSGMKIQNPSSGDENDDSVPDDHFPPSQADSEHRIFSNQALKICTFIINSLKKECREILPLYFKYKVMGDGIGQLATDVGKPLGSIAASVHRCLKKLYSHPEIIMLKDEIATGMS